MAISPKSLKRRLQGDVTSLMVSARIIDGLEKIIDGHLLLQREFPHQDHPSGRNTKVWVIFVPDEMYRERQESGAIWGTALTMLKERYPDWNLKLGTDWRSGGPWIILSRDESYPKRRRNIREMLEGSGHKLAPWRNWETRCQNPGCELEICMNSNSSTYHAGSQPVQGIIPCPCTEENVALHERIMRAEMGKRLSESRAE